MAESKRKRTSMQESTPTKPMANFDPVHWAFLCAYEEICRVSISDTLKNALEDYIMCSLSTRTSKEQWNAIWKRVNESTSNVPNRATLAVAEERVPVTLAPEEFDYLRGYTNIAECTVGILLDHAAKAHTFNALVPAIEKHLKKLRRVERKNEIAAERERVSACIAFYERDLQGSEPTA